jgi:hypothetical protein
MMQARLGRLGRDIPLFTGNLRVLVDRTKLRT